MKFSDFFQLFAMIGHTCICCCFYKLLVLNLNCMLHDVYVCLHPQRKKKHEVFVFARFCPSKRWRFSSPPLSWWSWIRTFNRRRDGLGVPNAASKWLHGFKTTKLNWSEELQVIFVSRGLEWKALWAFCSPSLRKDFASGWSVEENHLTYKRS